jgi:histidine triad (HIT) family protein
MRGERATREEDAMAYDPDNIFAKILRGEIPCQKIYEDDATFAFLDIMPRTDGHTLVIPKAPFVNLFDVDETSLAATIRTVRKLSPAVRDAFGAGGVTIQQFNEAAAGQMVFHLHFHILPRSEGVALRPAAGKMEDPSVLAANAEKIRAQLGKSA